MSQSSSASTSNARSSRRQEWIDARTARNIGVVEELGSRILSKAEDEQTRRALARLFTELGKSNEALIHWTRLRDQNSHDFEAAFHVAHSRIRNGCSAEAAVSEACPFGSAIFGENLRAVLEGREELLPQGTARHIAVCGTSYCGSTLMDRLLGGLPGVRSIGESHWLVKARYRHGYDLADFSKERSPKMIPCTVCGDSCPTLTREFRRCMAADHTNWYFRIARQLGTGILVSADKNLPKLVDNDPLLRLDALVLFKSPVQAWISARDKLPQDRDPAFYVSECRNYLTVWTRAYQTFFRKFRPQGNVVFLSFDVFAARADEIFAQLCGTLSLPFEEGALKMITSGHAIGGNSRALNRLRALHYRTEIAPLPEPRLPAGESKTIEAHVESIHLHDEMMAAFRSGISA